jgi:hypothetical protein
MTAEEQLKLFAEKVKLMREYQNKFFASRRQEDRQSFLRLSIGMEVIVDTMVTNVLNGQTKLF